jgi:raffinose/stachyose/melibiose transport system substrate-binding protein
MVRRWYPGAIAALVVFVAIFAVLASGAAARPHASGSLKFFTSTGQQPAFTVLVKNFQKAYPNINVSASYGPPGAGYGPVLTTMIQAGNTPDVFYGNGGTGVLESILPMGRAGKLLDLSKQKWVKRMPAASHDLFWSGQKLYGLQMDISPAGLIYNATALQQLGLKPPTTYAQLLTLCSKVSAAGKIPIAFPGAGGGTAMQLIAVSLGLKSAWNQARLASKTTFQATTVWQQAFQRLNDMKSKGCFQPGAQATAVPQALQLVGAGKALMFPAPSAAFATIQSISPGTSFKMLPFPGNTTKAKALVIYSDALAVSATAPDKASALTFVSFLAREGQSRLLAKLLGGVSVHDANVGNLPDTVTAFGPYFKSKNTVARLSDGWPGPAPLQALNTATSSVLAGQMSGDDALKSVDAAWGK